MNGNRFTWLKTHKRKARVRVEAGTARWAVWALLALAALPSQAQQLIAWPIGRPPGFFRPLPRPLPAPPPDPAPAPAPAPVPAPGPSPFPLTTTRPEADAFVLPATHGLARGTVRDQVAHLTLEVRFTNPTDQRLEGELYLPIPADVVFDRLEMQIGDKKLVGELLDAGVARSTYENIVRQMRDPALLELVSERLVRARVFPIEPRSDVVLRFTYAQVAERNGSQLTLRVPAARFTRERVVAAQNLLELDLETTKPLRVVQSPTHALTVKRDGDRKAAVAVTGGADRDIVLVYSLEDGELAATLTAYRAEGADGWFLLSLDPRPGRGAPSATPKDYVFVFDRSGSMQDDGKMEQARRALLYCVSKLAPHDRFAIVDFGTGVETFHDALLPATPQNVQRALAHVKALEASGGTNIAGGLERGLAFLKKEEGRLPLVLFLTDGRPTVGETDVEALLSAFRAGNAVRSRVFAFGVGTDLNTLLIDKLAQEGRGSRDYVLPGEDIEIAVSRLFDRISKPALTDLEIVWKGVKVSDVHPRKPTDVFYGDALVVLGRYAEGGRGSVEIRGRSGGKAVRIEVPVDLPAKEERNAFVPRLWAHRKVAHLLDEVRLGGKDNPEIVDEITRLAKRYGIVTPYTSFLIAEEADMARLRENARREFRAMASEAAAPRASAGRGLGGGVADALSAAKAQLFSRQIQGMISGAGSLGEAPAAPKPGLAGPDPADDESARVRTVGDKTFYRRGAGWVDAEAELEAGSGVEEVAAWTPRFIELARKHPELAKWVGLGGTVTVVLDGKAYRIVSR